MYSHRALHVLQPANRARDLALFNLAVDCKLGACDFVRLRVRDISHGDRVAAQTIVMKQKNHGRQQQVGLRHSSMSQFGQLRMFGSESEFSR
jgi:hypothetical protein